MTFEKCGQAEEDARAKAAMEARALAVRFYVFVFLLRSDRALLRKDRALLRWKVYKFVYIDKEEACAKSLQVCFVCLCLSVVEY